MAEPTPEVRRTVSRIANRLATTKRVPINLLGWLTVLVGVAGFVWTASTYVWSQIQ